MITWNTEVAVEIKIKGGGEISWRCQREHGGVEEVLDWELGAQVITLVSLVPTLYSLEGHLTSQSFSFLIFKILGLE